MTRLSQIALLAGLVLVAACASTPTTEDSAATAAQATPPLPQPVPLRVMSWNIRHGLGTDDRVDLERVHQVITAWNPDVVLLQEVDRNTQRSGGVDQATWLGQRMGFWSAFGAFMPYDGGDYGLAILSRWPLADVQNLTLPPGKHEPRTSLAATTTPQFAAPGLPGGTIGGPGIRLFNVHLDWLDDDANRFAQAQSLLDQISRDVARRDHGAPAIIGGDFNDVTGSRTLAVMHGSFDHAAKPSGQEATFPSDPTDSSPATEIDYIFVERGSRLTAGPAAAIGANGASDHRPVVTVVQIR